MPANRSIARVTLVVRDYDEAIEFYVNRLGFELVEDMPLPDEQKRWVVIAPGNGQGAELLLGKAEGSEQEHAVGRQAGGRVFLFLYTDNFWQDYNDFRARGVTFMENPRQEVYGTVAVFSDLYGNLWDLLEPAADAIAD